MESHKQGPYHHGQLRQALLDVALRVMSERGIEGLTLREVARQAGVSHAAPYHHFADKSALVEAVAVECFERLGSALREATRDGERSVERLVTLGKAYVRFALEQPEVFRLMYRPELRTASAAEARGQEEVGVGSRSGIDEAALETYQLLTEAVIACQQAGDIPAGDPALLTLTAWSTVHGLALLLLDGSPGSLMKERRGLEEAGRLAEQVEWVLLRGLLAREEA